MGRTDHLPTLKPSHCRGLVSAPQNEDDWVKMGENPQVSSPAPAGQRSSHCCPNYFVIVAVTRLAVRKSMHTNVTNVYK